MKITRTVCANRLREMCIKYNLCTRMTNGEYCEMLERTPELTDKTIPMLAEYIVSLSDTDRPVTNIAWLIATEATAVIVEE